MKRAWSGGSFRSALLVSLLIHGGLLIVFAGLGGVLAPEQAETKLEWVWSAPLPAAPQPVTQPAVPAPAGTTPTAATSAANPATVLAAPTTPQPTGPQPVVPPIPTPAVSSQPAISAGPSDDLPSGTGYAIVPPRLRERPPAAVPPQLRQAAATGEVLLQVEVLTDGRVGASRVIRSSGSKALDEMARQYVAGWTFQPAWEPQANKPVRVLTSVWVQFGTKKE